MLSVAVLIYAAGVLLGYLELIILASSAILALAVGFIWMVRTPNLEVVREIAPNRVTKGSPAYGELRLSNRTRMRSNAARAVERCGAIDISVDVPRLAPSAGTTKRYRLPTDKRGLFTVGPVQITRADPLGLWRKGKSIGGFEKFWVHPVTHLLTSQPAGRIKSLDGVASNRVTEGGVAFHALREYQMGDDMRMVHWRSSARTRQLMVRENLETSLPQITVVLDTRSEAHDKESFEQVVEAAASVVVASAEAHLPVRLVTTCGRGAGGKGRVRSGTLLDLLAEIDLAPAGEDLGSRMSQLSIQRRGDTLVVFSGTIPADEVVMFAGLGRRFNDSILCFVSPEAQSVAMPAGIKGRWIQSETARDFAQSWNRQVAR